jgi:hypothetical protein
MKGDAMDDPQPGDFDDALAPIDAELVEQAEPQVEWRLAFQITVRGEEAAMLGRLCDERDELPSDIIGSLIRETSRKAPVRAR